MRLHILSDLHLEFRPIVLPTIDSDVVILAGDIHAGEEGLLWARRTFPDKPVVYVLGNHEFYGFTLEQLTEKLQAESKGTNVHVLENGAIDIGDVTFIGATLWTDFALYGNVTAGSAVAERGMADFDLIHVRPTYRRARAADLIRLHQRSVDWLQAQFIARAGCKLVVVTHHPPSAKSIAPQFEGHEINPAFASNLEGAVADSGASLWVHGHTHSRFDYTLGSTRVVANQRGYEREVTGFQPDYVVEV